MASDTTQKGDGWESETIRHANPIEAKLAVMREVKYLLKTKSENLPYTYAGEAQLLEVLRPSMIRHGIAVRPSSVELLDKSEYHLKPRRDESQGALMFRVCLRMTFVFSYALADGTVATEEVQAVAAGVDNMDKSAPKALTMGLKYALRQSFLLETGDDPDKFMSQDLFTTEPEPPTAPHKNAQPPQQSSDEKRDADVGVILKFEAFCETEGCTLDRLQAAIKRLDDRKMDQDLAVEWRAIAQRTKARLLSAQGGAS